MERKKQSKQTIEFNTKRQKKKKETTLGYFYLFIYLLVCENCEMQKSFWNLPDDFFLEDRLAPPPRLISRRPISIFF